jgi:PAS domain S-box-containing protein
MMIDSTMTKEQLVEELAALRTQLAESRSVADSSSDYIMRYDRQHRHVYANRAALEATGLTLDEYVGKTHQEMGFPQELCELWETEIDRVFETGSPATIEFTVQLEQGKATLELKLHPEGQGSGATVLGISRDVTERAQATAALRESEQRFRRSLVLAPVPIMTPTFHEATNPSAAGSSC